MLAQKEAESDEKKHELGIKLKRLSLKSFYYCNCRPSPKPDIKKS
jgi:hypothetical protein